MAPLVANPRKCCIYCSIFLGFRSDRARMLHFLQHSALLARYNAEMLQVLQHFSRRLGESGHAKCQIDLIARNE